MIAVKGKKEAVTIFTLVGDKDFKESGEFKNLEIRHEKILENYFNQKWKNCLNEMKLAKSLCNNIMNEYYEIFKLLDVPEGSDSNVFKTQKVENKNKSDLEFNFTMEFKCPERI